MTETAGAARLATDFLSDFATLSAFGGLPSGGVNREAATDADGQQRAWFAGWLRDRGAIVAVDPIGNIFGLWELVPGAPYVLAGSHLDSQPYAGRFDGAYGVLAAAHAVHAIVERVRAGAAATPRYNLAVVDWFNEEGSRFQPSMMGSAVHIGQLPLEHALAVRDRAGIDVRSALQRIGGAGEDEAPPVAAYAEIHVEQGRHLEEAGIPIGLVDGTWAARKYRIRVIGEQAHTGPTPMADRRDALYGAALLTVEARRLADAHRDAPLHTSVAEIDVLPNSPVVVAREARILLDLRTPDEAALRLAAASLEASFARIEAEAKVEIEWTLEHSWGLRPFLPDGVRLGAEVADELGLPHLALKTVAGHDSTNMKEVVPTVMLFVPSVNGVSHNELELTRDEDLVAGLRVLTGVVERLARGGLDAD